MDTPLRLVALLLAGVVVTAALVPCPPSFELAGKASAAELSVKAKCPCSCAHGKAPGAAGGHLDFALARPEARSTPPFRMALAPEPLLPPLATPRAPADPVPI